jgi:hypothetical protein
MFHMVPNFAQRTDYILEYQDQDIEFHQVVHMNVKDVG